MTNYSDLAKVVKIIDSYNVVINRGSSNGVKVGQNFIVFRLGEHIADPDSGEDLGALEVVAGRARVVHIQPKMATLESIETRSSTRTIKRGPPYGLSSLAFAMAGTEEVRESTSVPLEAQVGDLARPY